MNGLTLEDLVVLKTLVKITLGESENLTPAEIRHYIIGSNLKERIEVLGFDVQAYNLGDLPKLKQSTLSEIKVKTV